MDTEVDGDKKLVKERYELAGRINESTSFIFSLVRRLSQQDVDNGRMEVIAGMLRDEYTMVASMVEYYKQLGGESYSIDHGMWRDMVGY